MMKFLQISVFCGSEYFGGGAILLKSMAAFQYQEGTLDDGGGQRRTDQVADYPCGT